ncbi:MAG: sialate O-acetylesterase [Bacilli bacterium]|jgi:sialate O-acetylesterase
MRKFKSIFIFFLMLSTLFIVNTNYAKVKASPAQKYDPLIQYDFADSENLGKDVNGNFDLNIIGNPTKTTDGIYLDGSSALYYAPLANKDFTDELEAFTITVWAKEDAVQSSHRFMIGTGVAFSTTGLGMGFYATNGAYIVPVGGADDYASNFVTSQADHFGPKAPNYQASTAWNCFTLMLQNGTSYFGVNGDLYTLNISVDMANIQNLGQTFTIGGVGGNDVTNINSIRNLFIGEIADVRIYNGVLTDTEFKAIYNAGRKAASPLTRNNVITAINTPLSTEGYHFSLECADLTTSGILTTVKDITADVKVDRNGVIEDMTAKVVWCKPSITSEEATINGVIYLVGYACTADLLLKVHLYKGTYSNIRLNTTFTDNMVLQRDQNVKIFGYGGNVGEEVKVQFASQVKIAHITETGWAVYLEPMRANKVGQDLKVTYKHQVVTLTNVVVGDVLLCSGQSNMEITVQYILNKDANIRNEFLSLNNYANIRVYNGSSVYLEKNVPTIYDDTMGRSWQLCSDFDSIRNHSAYAMAAASNYSSVVGEEVPIGVIIVAIGGSCIEEWVDPVNINSFHSYAADMGKVDCRYYNAYIYNLAGYTVNAFLWYQGEANSQPLMTSDYQTAFRLMLNHYRDLFENPTMPAIVQQLVQFDNWVDTSYFRIMQWEFMSTLDYVYTVNGIDTGDMSKNDGIHPTDKWVLGERVAGILALANGIAKEEMLNQNIPYGISSEIKAASYVENDGVKTITLTTTNEDDVWHASGAITGFQILSGGVWNDVVATIVDGKIQIETQLEEVTQVRYSFFNGYINSGSQAYAKVGTPVYVYDERNLPLAVSAGVAIKKHYEPQPPGPPPIPVPDDDSTTDSSPSSEQVGDSGMSRVGLTALVTGLTALGASITSLAIIFGAKRKK